jgi:hypothetical protein
VVVGVTLACVALVVGVAVLASGSEGSDATTSARMAPAAVIDVMLVIFGLLGLVALGLLVRTLLADRSNSPAGSGTRCSAGCSSSASSAGS